MNQHESSPLLSSAPEVSGKMKPILVRQIVLLFVFNLVIYATIVVTPSKRIALDWFNWNHFFSLSLHQSNELQQQYQVQINQKVKLWWLFMLWWCLQWDYWFSFHLDVQKQTFKLGSNCVDVTNCCRQDTYKLKKGRLIDLDQFHTSKLKHNLDQT